MKSYTFLFVLGLAIVAQAEESELKKKVLKLREDCQKETNAPVEILDKYDKGEYEGDGKDLNCYAKCFFLKAGFMNDSGELNLDAMKEMVKGDENEEKMLKIIDHCHTEHHTDIKDPCELAFKAYKCVKAHMKEQNILV